MASVSRVLRTAILIGTTATLLLLSIFPYSTFASTDQPKKLTVRIEDQDGNPVQRYPVHLAYEDVLEGEYSPATFNLSAGLTYELYLATWHGDYTFDYWKDDEFNSIENSKTFRTTENSSDIEITAVIKKDPMNSPAKYEPDWRTKYHDVKITDEIYFLSYDTSSGVFIESMAMNSQTKTLSIYLENVTSNNGQLRMEIPRKIFDSMQNETLEKDFVITVSNQTIKDAPPKRFLETITTHDMRTLLVDFHNGTELVEIRGTHVVPEYGSIAPIITAAVSLIVVVVAASTRFRLKIINKDLRDNG